MTQASLTLRRWRRAEYERLADLGVFQGEPIELIGGQLVVAELRHPDHASAITAAEYALRAVLPPGWIVRTQLPVSLDDESEPEPDLVVVPGGPADYRHEHPAHPALAIEVATSSLQLDRDHKGSLYARAGIEDYWIVNLVDRLVEVYRDPAPDPSAPYGWRYRSLATSRPPAVVVPFAFTSSHVAVADLLPSPVGRASSAPLHTAPHLAPPGQRVLWRDCAPRVVGGITSRTRGEPPPPAGAGRASGT